MIRWLWKIIYISYVLGYVKKNSLGENNFYKLEIAHTKRLSFLKKKQSTEFSQVLKINKLKTT